MWTSLIRLSWYAALLLTLVAIVGLALAIGSKEGTGQLQMLTVILSPESQPMEISVLPPIKGVAPIATGAEVEIQVPLAIGLLSYASFAIRTLAGLFVLYQLQRVFALGAHFAEENPHRIRLAGLVVIGAEAANIALSLVQEIWTRQNLAAEGWRVSIPIDRDIHLLVAGFVLLAVAEAYRAGLALREEAEFTV